MYNALCGDRVDIHLRVTGEQVEAAAFDGEACAICRASASMLCGLAPARPVAWLRSLSARLHQALGGFETTLPEELEPLLGVRRYPSRRRCATLPWEAAVKALDHPVVPAPNRGATGA
jgi:nitrogen fixation NifU-like protein